MLGLLAAATLAVSTPGGFDIKVLRSAPSDADMPMHLRGRACGMWDAQPVARKVPDARAERLDELPAANLELSVLRLDEKGCSKPVIVRENVNGDGRFAKPRD